MRLPIVILEGEEYLVLPDVLAVKDDVRFMALWNARWPNFAPWELHSKDDWSLKIRVASLDRLQLLRASVGVPLSITSAYRTPAHNRRVRGGRNSQHMAGRAFDIVVTSREMAERVEAAALTLGFTAIGRYPKQSFIHIDDREPKRSGKPFRWGAWSWRGLR